MDIELGIEVYQNLPVVLCYRVQSVFVRHSAGSAEMSNIIALFPFDVIFFCTANGVLLSRLHS